MANYEVTGIDVSKWQREIDWHQALSKGISFAFIRASEGNRQVDPYFERNLAETGRLGIPRGIYHYFKPDKDWRKQVELFSALVNGNEFELDAALDVESDDGLSKNEVNNALAKFVRWAEEAITPRKLMIYTSAGFFNGQLPLTGYAWRCPLWIANWTIGAYPALPREWRDHKKGWRFWQHSSKNNGLGPDYGVATKSVGLNRYNGGLSKFKSAYRLPGDIPSPPPPPPPPLSEAPLYRVLPASLHVFDHPGVNAPIVGEVARGQVLPLLDVLGLDEVWVKIGGDPDRWVLHSYNGQQLLGRV